MVCSILIRILLGIVLEVSEVLPMEKLEDVIQRNGVQIGIITVPAGAAQKVSERLVDARSEGNSQFFSLCN